MSHAWFVLFTIGIGKTTLTNHICVKWARDGFLAEDFDIVILIPLRTVQQQSLEETIIEHIGIEAYQQLKNELGKQCLLILEGLDEMTVEQQKCDSLLYRLIHRETLVEAKLLVTSRPHACQDLKATVKIEVVGFSEKRLKKYIKNIFPDDAKSVQGLLKQLDENPSIKSLCYVPLSVNMIVELFQDQGGSLPSTLTALYKSFIVGCLNKHLEKLMLQPTSVALANGTENLLHQLLPEVPEEATDIVLSLSKLAFHAFFKWSTNREREDQYCRKVQYKDPRIIFKEQELLQEGITLPKNSDGFSLLKNFKIPRKYRVFNFTHLSVQEFLCALHLALNQSKEEQFRILHTYFAELPNIIVLLCGITALRIPGSLNFLLEQIKSANNDNVVTAAKCLYESKKKCPQDISPLTVTISSDILCPYDIISVSHLVYHYPVATLRLRECSLGNKELKLLAYWADTEKAILEELDISVNNFTTAGLVHIINIMKSETRIVVLIVANMFIGSVALKILDIGGSKIGDVGVEILLEALQYKNSLTDLRMWNCGLTIKSNGLVSWLSYI